MAVAAGRCCKKRGNDAYPQFSDSIVQNANNSFLSDDRNAALRSGSVEGCVAMLRQVPEPFLGKMDHQDERQIGIFDQILVRLVEIIKTRTRAEVSESMAAVANARFDPTPKLARHSENEIARTGSQDHFLAISQRARIEAAVTAVLLDDGSKAVAQSVAGNPEARFSERGLAALQKMLSATVAPAAGVQSERGLRAAQI